MLGDGCGDNEETPPAIDPDLSRSSGGLIQRLLQRQRHAAKTERDLKASLNAMQLKNDAVGVL